MFHKFTKFSVLQYRDFAWLWISLLISTLGAHMQITAINWHIYSLLQEQSVSIDILNHEISLNVDALGLGFVGLIRVIPTFIFALLGGLIADTKNRKKVMIWTQSIEAIAALLLAFISFSNMENIFVIYALTMVGSAAYALDSPARQSIVPNLVPRSHLTDAISLMSLIRQISIVIGPALAGILISRFDIEAIYLINGVSFSAVILSLLAMKHDGNITTRKAKMDLHSLKEGFIFVRYSSLIWSTMLIDFWATFFASTRTLLPIIANDLLGVGASGYGFLATAQAIGAILTGIVLATGKRIQYQGIVLIGSVMIFGVATILFGLFQVFWLSFLLLAITGMCDSISIILRNTIRHQCTPDRLRGRMTSVNMLFSTGGPQLGELEAGIVASVAGVPMAIVTGGIATILTTIMIVMKYPIISQYNQNISIMEKKI